MASHFFGEYSPAAFYEWDQSEEQYEQLFSHHMNSQLRFQQAGFEVAEIKDVIWTAIDCFMKQFYFANSELQPPPRAVPTELHLPWLIARPAGHENADEHHPVDIFIRPLQLRVGWVYCAAPGSEMRLWQPVVAGVGNVKATGIVMGPRLLKARLINQTANHRAAAGAGRAELNSLTSIGYITKEGRQAERHNHAFCRMVWDQHFNACLPDDQDAAIEATVWQEISLSVHPALGNPASNPAAQPPSTQWSEFQIKMQKFPHAAGHSRPPALFFRLIFDPNVPLWFMGYFAHLAHQHPFVFTSGYPHAQ